MEQTPYISADILSIIHCKGGAKHRELKEEEIVINFSLIPVMRPCSGELLKLHG
jgi:hypothetical protein